MIIKNKFRQISKKDIISNERFIKYPDILKIIQQATLNRF